MTQVVLTQMQTFTRSELRQMIQDDTLGPPAPEPQEEGGPDLHYFLLDDDTFALITLQQETTHKGRKNCQLQQLQ